MAERRAMAAERDATDRYVAAFLADRVGAEFAGRITGVTRFGLFVRLAETGADGLVPVSSLGGEYFIHDERAHALVGERTGRRWRARPRGGGAAEGGDADHRRPAVRDAERPGARRQDRAPPAPEAGPPRPARRRASEAAPMSLIRVWGRLNSINVQKVMWTLDELDLAYEHIPAGGDFGLLGTPEFRAMNPHGLAPTIDDDGTIVWESNAIVRYLAAEYGDGGLWPSAPRVRALADRWMDWTATALQPHVMGHFWGWWRTPRRDGTPR